jgi:hypothetical protein
VSFIPSEENLKSGVSLYLPSAMSLWYSGGSVSRIRFVKLSRISLSMAATMNAFFVSRGELSTQSALADG